MFSTTATCHNQPAKNLPLFKKQNGTAFVQNSTLHLVTYRTSAILCRPKPKSSAAI